MVQTPAVVLWYSYSCHLEAFVGTLVAVVAREEGTHIAVVAAIVEDTLAAVDTLAVAAGDTLVVAAVGTKPVASFVAVVTQSRLVEQRGLVQELESRKLAETILLCRCRFPTTMHLFVQALL